MPCAISPTTLPAWDTTCFTFAWTIQKNEQSFDANLTCLIREQRITRFEYMQPDDYRLDHQLARLAAHLSIFTAVADTEHFLTVRNDLARHFQGKKQYLMDPSTARCAGAMIF